MLAENIVKNKEKIASSGTKVLIIGVALLIFTFISAFVFLTENLQILATQNMAQTFGEALVPLIATCVRVMYLGVMGWIGSLITIRGITILNSSPKVEVSGTQSQEVLQKTQPKPQRAQEKTKRETKTKVEPAEPEMVVIPMEEMQQQKKPV